MSPAFLYCGILSISLHDWAQYPVVLAIPLGSSGTRNGPSSWKSCTPTSPRQVDPVDQPHTNILEVNHCCRLCSLVCATSDYYLGGPGDHFGLVASYLLACIVVSGTCRASAGRVESSCLFPLPHRTILHFGPSSHRIRDYASVGELLTATPRSYRDCCMTWYDRVSVQVLTA